MALALVDPVRGLRLANRANRLALAQDDPVAQGLAMLAEGNSHLSAQRVAQADLLFRKAIAIGDKHDNLRLRSTAQVRLAATLAALGRTEEAESELQQAISSLEGADRDLARSQLAGLYLEMHRGEESLALLGQVLPALRRNDSQRELVKALSNRGLAHARLRHFTAAERDLIEAESVSAEGGQSVSLAVIAHNLGYLASLRGDIPTALDRYAHAQHVYTQLGVQYGDLSRDQAEVLLLARLLDEARAAADDACRQLRHARRWLDYPEAKLLLSTIALLQRDHETALRAAVQAARGFRRAGRKADVALARLAGLQASYAKDPAQVRPATARRIAQVLEESGRTIPALEARVIAGALALQRGSIAQAQEDLARAAKARLVGPPDARARAWLGLALLRVAQGDRRGAYRALMAGNRVIEHHRSSLGASELRAHVTANRGAIARTGLQMAVEDQQPAKAHFWAEQGRHRALLLRPVTPPTDAVLAELLAQLRSVTGELEHVGAGARRALSSEQRRLEHAIRHRVRQTPAELTEPAVRTPDRAVLRDSCGERAILELVQIGDLLAAVVFVAGQFHLLDLGRCAQAWHSATHIPFALDRLAGNLPPDRAAAALAVVIRGAQAFQRELLDPVMPLIGDRELVVVAPDALSAFPWALLPSLRGRPLSVTPSVTLWNLALIRRPASGTVVVVTGPGLNGAESEARVVAAQYPLALMLRGPDATAAKVAAALDGASIAHIAAHGQLRADNPLFSAFLLADGPFTVLDLERLGTTPHHMVMASCHTARSMVVAGRELLGLSGALLSQDTASLVAPVVAVPDDSTVELMGRYHHRLRDGDAPATALAAVQAEALRDPVDPVLHAAAAAFICLGAG